MLATLFLSLAVLSTSTLSQDLNTRGESCQLGEHVNKVDLLNLHNQARNLMGVNKLHWDDSLACFSQKWAENCVFEHSHREGYGENIACGYGNNYEAQTGVKDWYEEIHHWNPRVGYSETTGHATQMGWRDTTSVGCGIAVCPANKLELSNGNEKALYLVCNYYPAGNYLGHFIGEVNVPSSNQMVDLKYNATRNDANPALFGTNTASVAQTAHHKVDAQLSQALPKEEEHEESQGSKPSNEEQTTPHNRPPPQHKNQHTTYTGTGGFVTHSWKDLQAWIKEKCAKGLAYKYNWHSTWDVKKRSDIDPSKPPQRPEGKSRKGTSKFINRSMGLHRRLMRKRRITTKL